MQFQDSLIEQHLFEIICNIMHCLNSHFWSILCILA